MIASCGLGLLQPCVDLCSSRAFLSKRPPLNQEYCKRRRHARTIQCVWMANMVHERNRPVTRQCDDAPPQRIQVERISMVELEGRRNSHLISEVAW